MESTRFIRKYLSLFQPAKVRYKVITGGRGSGKSFVISSALVRRTYDDDFNILFTRWTMESAKDSVIPEFKDKMERLGVLHHFHEWRTSVQNLGTRAKVLFRGLKQSTKNQIAKLKSLFKIKIWVLDEAQELVDESLFDTIDNSIRDADTTCEVWLVLNPTDITHWIYRRFFVENGVEIGFNGIKDGVEYIHTTYLDNLANLDQGFIDKAEKLKRTNYEKYCNVYLGHWAKNKEGLIFPNWEEISADKYPEHLPQVYGNDWGYGGDPNALVRMCYDALTQTIYLKEIVCKQLIPSDVYKAIRADAETIGYDLGDCLVYCDPARPDNITELRRRGVSSVKAVNRDKAGRISYLKGFKVKYVGENIRKEVSTYSWQPHPQDSERFTDKPQDGNDHCFTANTKIFTKQGYKRIVDIKRGDEVQTSEGWRKVLKLWDNGEKEVLSICLNFSNFSVYIEATPDHLFKTDKGWKQLQSLQEGDKLFLHSALMAEYTASTKARSTTLAIDGNYTAMCGRFIMGLYRKAIKCITRISTPTITRLITLFALRLKSIIESIRSITIKADLLNGSENTQIKSDRLHRNGIEVKRAGLGIENTQRCRKEKTMNVFAPSAAKPLPQEKTIQNIAQISVQPKHAGIADLIMKQESVLCAASHLKQTDTESRDFAECLVLQSIELHSVKMERVYDLTVDDCHEYYANGILVHNCIDAALYVCCTHLRRMGILNEDGED